MTLLLVRRLIISLLIPYLWKRWRARSATAPRGAGRAPEATVAFGAAAGPGVSR